jgi:predicted dehydrogenase
MGETLGVGVVGANPTRGWAVRTHLPAIKALDEFDLVAVATTRQESADETARTFSVPHAFADARALVEAPYVDVVAICVKVPEHFAIVHAALEAGKHVFCEWPLGASSQEAKQLEQVAAARSVANVVGLQGSKSPAVNYLRDLVAGGSVGEVLSVSVAQRSSSRGRREVPADEVWETDAANGATLSRITGGHTIDILQYCVGDLVELTSTVATRYGTASVIGSGVP